MNRRKTWKLVRAVLIIIMGILILIFPNYQFLQFSKGLGALAIAFGLFEILFFLFTPKRKE